MLLKGTLVTFDLLVALGAIGQKYQKMPRKMLCRDRIMRAGTFRRYLSDIRFTPFLPTHFSTRTAVKSSIQRYVVYALEFSSPEAFERIRSRSFEVHTDRRVSERWK